MQTYDQTLRPHGVRCYTRAIIFLERLDDLITVKVGVRPTLQIGRCCLTQTAGCTCKSERSNGVNAWIMMHSFGFSLRAVICVIYTAL